MNEDRGLPRSRIIIVLVAVVAAFVSVRSATAQPSADEPRLEDQPYSIRVWIAVDPAARIGKPTVEAIVNDWLLLTRRFVGAPWNIEVQNGEGPLQGRSPDALEPQQVAPLVEGADKGWFLRIEAAPSGGGFSLLGREYDETTRQLGPLYRQPAPYPSDASRSLFELTRRVFSPIAEIERSDLGAEIRVQGASLPSPDRSTNVVQTGLVFRPYYIFLGPNDTIREIRSIPFTYLHVDQIEGPIAKCEVVSGLRQPLPRQVAGRYRLVALGLKPADVPSRFRFLAGDDERQIPVAGYVLTSRGIRDRITTEVGTTDREGRITLPPKFSNSLVMLRLLAAGVEPLREFPVLPGETTDERVIPVEPRPDAVTLEFRLKALQDEIVDLIARRGVLEARLDARATGQAWDEVKELLDEYQQLTPRRDFEERVARLTENAQRSQAERGVPILTRTAQAELAETRALIERYLDDEGYDAFLDAYQRSLDGDAAAGTPAAVATSPAVRSNAARPAAVAPAQRPSAPAEASPPQQKQAAPLPKQGGSGVPF